jgi:alkylation response protein AidB-like acyl-CoA dehydrogenase
MNGRRPAIFPAHELFKKLGDLGLLGIKYDTAYGGMGLDFSYSMVMAEALGDCQRGRRAPVHRRADRHVHPGPARASAPTS